MPDEFEFAEKLPRDLLAFLRDRALSLDQYCRSGARPTVVARR
jgi:hypothetical protein